MQYIIQIVSKTLAYRLEEVIPMTISPFQGAFIQDRNINNNIIVTHETLNFLEKKIMYRQGFMAIQSEMEKANNRLE